MQINPTRNINFKSVYAVFGTKNEVEKFDKDIRKNLDNNSYVDSYDATLLYANNKPMSKGILTTAANNGKEVRLYLTGKDDIESAETTPWGYSYMTQFLSYVVDLSKKIPKDFIEDFKKSAQK